MPGIHVSVVVFCGEPFDYQKWRHVGLWFHYPESEGTTYAHMAGIQGEFKFEIRENYAAGKSSQFAKQIDVGELPDSVSKAQLIALLYRNPAQNDNLEFNCQTWVGDVLTSMSHAGYLTPEQAFNGISEMISATLEARDEDAASV